RVYCLHAGVFINDLEDTLDPLTTSFRLRPSRQALSHRVHADNLRGCIGGNHPVTDSVQRRSKVFFTLFQRSLRSTFGGLVPEDHHDATDTTVQSADWGCAIRNGSFASIACNERGVIGQSNDDAFSKDTRNRIFSGFSRLFVHDVEDIANRLAERVFKAPSS